MGIATKKRQKTPNLPTSRPQGDRLRYFGAATKWNGNHTNEDEWSSGGMGRELTTQPSPKATAGAAEDTEGF